MGRQCAAFGCTNNSGKESCKEKNISFHNFPLHDPSRLQKWLANLQRKDFTPNSYSAVCSEHFTEKNFIYQSFTKTRLLKKDAIPTIFFHTEEEIPKPVFNQSKDFLMLRDSLEARMASNKKTSSRHRKNFKAFIGKTEKECNKCGFVTFSLHVLYNHKYKCQGQLLGKPVFCSSCKRKFSFLALYRTHKKTCVKKMMRKNFLKSKLRHKFFGHKRKLKLISNKFSFSCPICHDSFKLKSDFVSHLKQQNCTQQKIKKCSFSARKSLNKSSRSLNFSDKKGYSSMLDQEENFFEPVSDKVHNCKWCKSSYPSTQLFFMHLKMNDECALEYYKNNMNNTNKKLSTKARKTLNVVARKSFPNRKYSEKAFNSKRNFDNRSARKTLSSPYGKKINKKTNSAAANTVVNQCPVCYEKFPETFTFYQHQKMTNHWGKATKSFATSCKCPFCGKEFVHIRSRNAHVCTHSDKSDSEIKAFLKSCTCNVCSQIFVSESAKLQHMRIKHSTSIANSSKYGSSGSELNTASDNENRDKHKMSSVPTSVKKKLKQQPNTCPVCSKAFSHTVLRNKHFNEVHLKIFECQFCNTKFKSTSSLSNHIQLTHGKNLDCKSCKANFSNELQLLQHVLKYHPNQDPKLLLPSKQGKNSSFKEKYLNTADEINFRQVEKTSFNNDSQRRNIEYYCDVCNIGYQKLCGLQRHRQSKLHKDTLVKNLDAFQKSISDLPSSPPPYPRAVKQPDILTCSECSEDFTNIKDFVPHRLSHFSVQSKYLKINELNPYMCEICSDVLDSHSKVQLHLFWHLQIESTSNKNTSMGPSKNDTIVPDRLSGQHVAKKSFSKPSKESLQEVIIGGVAKPIFTCEACNIGFTTKVHYNMHIRKLCKKMKPPNQLSNSEANKNSFNSSGKDTLHCGNCNCLFSSEANFQQHKEFCTKCYFDSNSEENLKNLNIVKSTLDSDTVIAGCITCPALFDNISSIAVHLSIHQTNDNSHSGEIAVLHCALCNCLFSLNAFKLHKEFCKIPISVDRKKMNSKNMNILKSTLELECAVAVCIHCESPFDDFETFSKHLMLHQTNQIQNMPEDNKLCNGEASITTINMEDKNCLPNNPIDFLTENVEDNSVSDDQEHLNSPSDFINKYPSNSSLETENQKSTVLSSNQKINEASIIEDLRENFSKLLCVLISDPELMQKLGYGVELVDTVLVNVLNQMGQEPCFDNLSEIDVLRKNIQKFLHLCLKDQVLQAIGKEKVVDEIVIEALKVFSSEENELDDE